MTATADAPEDAASARAIRDTVRALLDHAREHDGLLPIVKAGDPVLRTECAPVDGQLDDAELRELSEAMLATMLAAPGVGLAAPQVGVPLRMFVAQDTAADPDVLEASDPEAADRLRQRERAPFAPRTVLNSRYEAATGRTASFYEGCLSIPGYQAVVDRPRAIALTGCDLDGSPLEEELTGWPARIVAHESDHLDGVLYLDSAQMRSLASDEAVARWWARADVREAAAALGFEIPATTVF
ncbi:peptide deformylase [Brevibacterium album]|uniref:peptide deformylase n=1 Tax=Brevibacterium album TaxID=417948 RepID=UPI0004267976|nr:peptide deformylase [Brevibacterium album]